MMTIYSLPKFGLLMNKPEDNSEKLLVQRLKQGDKTAANELIDRYFDRVVAAAKRSLGNRRVHVTSGDDIAASVFESLWRCARDNRFDEGDLKDGEELWRLLCKMIQYKSRDHIRRELTQKRGGGILKGESGFAAPMNGQPAKISEVPQNQHSVSDLAIFDEEHKRLIKLLNDDTLIQIAMMRLEGYKVSEIADTFEKSKRWVTRKLSLIRAIWKTEFEATR